MSLTKFLHDLGRPVVYYPRLAKVVGGVKPAVLLCQLLYWHDRIDPAREGWFFKSVEELEEETGMTYKEQLAARTALEVLGLIQSDYRRLEHRVYFKVNRDQVNTLWDAYIQGEKPPSKKNIAELVRDAKQPKAEPAPSAKREDGPYSQKADGHIPKRQMDDMPKGKMDDMPKSHIVACASGLGPESTAKADNRAYSKADAPGPEAKELTQNCVGSDDDEDLRARTHAKPGAMDGTPSSSSSSHQATPSSSSQAVPERWDDTVQAIWHVCQYRGTISAKRQGWVDIALDFLRSQFTDDAAAAAAVLRNFGPWAEGGAWRRDTPPHPHQIPTDWWIQNGSRCPGDPVPATLNGFKSKTEREDEKWQAHDELMEKIGRGQL